MDILEAIDELIIQATKERSHYYTKKVLEQAKEEIINLRNELIFKEEMTGEDI